jgi:hypothetical protein
MNKRRFYPGLLFMIIVVIVVTAACQKKENEDCKTCRALNTNGSVAAEQQVCTESQQAAFYSANAGKEIVCN